jgi:hypothetical protein
MKVNNINKIVIHLHADDNIAVACENLIKNEKVVINDKEIRILNNISLAHKLAFVDIKKGDKVIKFGAHIGSAIKDIKVGEHVHLHNIKSDYITTERS